MRRTHPDSSVSRDKVDVGIQFRARALTTVPDSTSQKFVLLAQIARKDQDGDGRFAMIHLDFSPTRKRQCKDGDFERWYARSHEHECVMGHKVWEYIFSKYIFGLNVGFFSNGTKGANLPKTVMLELSIKIRLLK